MSRTKRPLIPLAKFPEQLQKFVSEETPSAAARLVLQGLVPTSGSMKLCALYQVAHLHDSLYQAAGIALSQVSSQEVVSGLEGLPPPILDWVAEVCIRDPDCSAGVFAHPLAAVSTLMRLLSTCGERVASQLAQNQVKLMSNPVFLQCLCLNPSLPVTIKDRLIELARYESVDLSWLPKQQEPSSELEEIRVQESPLPSSSDQIHPSSEAEHDLKFVSQQNPLALVSSEGRAPTVSRLDRPGLDLSLFPDQVQKFLAPDAPAQVLNLVLGGLFPMPSSTRLLALYHIAVTRQELSVKAKESVRAMGSVTLIDSISSVRHGSALDWLADCCLAADDQPEDSMIPEGADLITALSTHPNVAEETIARIALFSDQEGCERIALNQERLIRQPSIIHSLYYNPKLSTVQADRLLEFAAREGVDLSWLPDAGDVLGELQQSEYHDTGDDALRMAIELGKEEDPKDAAIQAVLQEHAARRADESSEKEEGKPKKGYALIQSLNVAQKIRLALLGSQSDRALLVKDSNKVVSRAAIRSPAVSVSEALLYARNHSLNASIIEYIARNRKWMQNYRVKVQIVLNPKTPINIALNALNTLRPAELRAVAQSHNVSGILSQKAKELIKKRQG